MEKRRDHGYGGHAANGIEAEYVLSADTKNRLAHDMFMQMPAIYACLVKSTLKSLSI